MIELREGDVVQVTDQGEGWTEALIDFGEGPYEKAISFHALTGPLRGGERVTLNTTAVKLGLGTGGLHFVCAVHGATLHAEGPGHIMKVRYTPSQVKVLCVEEAESPYRAQMERIPDLNGMPVLVGSLHSQLPILAACLRSEYPKARLVYIMTDGAALPAAFSRTISRLKEASLIDLVITAGHAFGGDYEAVSPPSALAASYSVAHADVAIVLMGPGVVGTGSPLGTTALEQAPWLDAAGALGAEPIAVVRASETDRRNRHFGISHHTLTALGRFTHRRVAVPLTQVTGQSELARHIRAQAQELAERGHRLVWESGEDMYRSGKRLLLEAGISVTTMGRTDRDDPLFFWMTAAAAAYALRVLRTRDVGG